MIEVPLFDHVEDALNDHFLISGAEATDALDGEEGAPFGEGHRVLVSGPTGNMTADDASQVDAFMLEDVELIKGDITL